MARSQQSWNKIENEKKKQKKKKDKAARKLERASNTADGNNPDSMIAYVDEYGRISDTPPDPATKSVIKAEEIEIGVGKKKISALKKNSVPELLLSLMIPKDLVLSGISGQVKVFLCTSTS